MLARNLLARTTPFALLIAATLPACDPVPEVSCSDGWEGCACHDDGECGSGLVCDDAQICVDPAHITEPTEPAEAEAHAIDLLFVIDDSASMGAKQAEVARSIGALLDPLTATGADLRIAITTTDRGNPQCEQPGVSAPEAGRAVLQSCRASPSAFISPLAEYGDQSTACTQTCALDSIEVSPTTTLADATARERPWIESSASGSNLLNATVHDALACAIPRGVAGCGFEAPLDAVHLFLERTADPQDATFDFLRPQADFVTVIISDEADCSANPALEAQVFGAGGGPFDINDTAYRPTSATCWAAGVHCEGDVCEPRSHGIDGNLARDSESSVLVPVEDYVDELAALRLDKQAHAADVYVFGLLGVPEGYRGAMDYLPGPDPDDPESFQGKFGIGPGCGSVDDGAVPPVRMRAVLESPTLGEGQRLFSVCADDYRPAFENMAQTITATD